MFDCYSTKDISSDSLIALDKQNERFVETVTAVTLLYHLPRQKLKVLRPTVACV